MRYLSSDIMILVSVIAVGACAPARTQPAVAPATVTNWPTLTLSAPAEATLPPTETMLPSLVPVSPTAVDLRAFTEYISGPLWVHLFSPQDETVVQTAQIFVTVQAPVETVISLNEAIYVVSADQSFNIPVDLEEGLNALEFVASDLGGNEVAFTLTVTYEP